MFEAANYILLFFIIIWEGDSTQQHEMQTVSWRGVSVCKHEREFCNLPFQHGNNLKLLSEISVDSLTGSSATDMNESMCDRSACVNVKHVCV